MSAVTTVLSTAQTDLSVYYHYALLLYSRVYSTLRPPAYLFFNKTPTCT